MPVGAGRPPVSTPANVGDALCVATRSLGGSPTARLDAEVLLAHVMGISRSALLARGREALTPEESVGFEALVARRAGGEPVAYVTGLAHFVDLVLEVTPDVLIPRPETELLAEWAIARAARRRPPVIVLDVGTGSGALALAIATAVPALEIHATDVSPRALAVARRNADRLDLAEAVSFHRADLLPDAPGHFDLVVANLPYVGWDESRDVAVEVRDWEPHVALFSGADGLSALQRLFGVLPSRLAPGADVGVEIGWQQGPIVIGLARGAFSCGDVTLRRDLAGLDRFVTIEGIDAESG